TPSLLAKIVWSLPRPTNLPGWNFVPRWRTMMAPREICWLPNTFTPSRWAAESRPVLVLPPAFFWAIACSFSRDVVDIADGRMLAVGVFAIVVLAAFFLENDHFVAFFMVQHSCLGAGAGLHGRAHLAVDAEDIAQGHGFAFLAIEQFIPD